MSKAGAIVLIEDDEDDRTLFRSAIDEMGIKNELIFLGDVEEAFEFLYNTHLDIFIIFSDINVQGSNALGLKKKIDGNKKLRKKSIPFIFYSTAVHQKEVDEAYTEMTIQGFFKKGKGQQEIKDTIKLILDYWMVCLHPNT